ncbi:proton-coupled folate transporter-like isoform X2 [Babylonia areolata]
MSDEQPTVDDRREEESADSKEPLLQVRRPKLLVLPEVVTFLYFTPLVTQFPLIQFWLYDHFSREYNLVTSNDSSVCGNSSVSNSSIADLEKEVQSQTNKYVLYTNFISNFVAIFPAIFLGPLTDKYGRKFVFYVSLSGLFASLLLNVFIYHFDLSPALICVSSFIQGLSGSYGLFLAACFGIVADISSPGKQRMFRVTTVEATLAIASSIATTTAGIWVKELGYIWPMAFCLGEVALATIYVRFLIPETLVERHYHPFSYKTFLKSFDFYVKDNPSKRRFKMIVYILCFVIIFWAFIGEANFGILFLLHQPFCWSKVKISVFNGVMTLLKWVVVVLLILLGKRCISEPVFALMGSVSAASSFLLKGLAKNNAMIFIGAGASLMMDLVGPMCRTMMSKSVSLHEQGALFTGIGVLQMITSTVSGVVMSNIYNVGLDVYLGLPYLVLAGLVFLNVFLLIASIIYGRRHPGTEEAAAKDEDDERLIS